MDTPSLVIVGAPHFFSRTTLRPLGPSVTFTASARVFIPFSSPRRASSLKAISFGITPVIPSGSLGVTWGVARVQAVSPTSQTSGDQVGERFGVAGKEVEVEAGLDELELAEHPAALP